jgi:hypothetical protein
MFSELLGHLVAVLRVIYHHEIVSKAIAPASRNRNTQRAQRSVIASPTVSAA